MWWLISIGLWLIIAVAVCMFLSINKKSTNMFKEHDRVQTRKSLMHDGSAIPAKASGTIVHVYDVTPPVYIVELPLYKSNPLIIDLKENDIEPFDNTLTRSFKL